MGSGVWNCRTPIATFFFVTSTAPPPPHVWCTPLPRIHRVGHLPASPRVTLPWTCHDSACRATHAPTQRPVTRACQCPYSVRTHGRSVPAAHSRMFFVEPCSPRHVRHVPTTGVVLCPVNKGNLEAYRCVFIWTSLRVWMGALVAVVGCRSGFGVHRMPPVPIPT